MSDNRPDFDGLCVVAFESRRAEDMTRMIEKHGGRARVSPSMREVPLEDDSHTADFAHQLITGQIDIMIFMTGVGFRHLLASVERRVQRDRFLGALSDITTITRGPKPVVAMKEVALKPTYQVGKPNTWREVLALVDEHMPVANQVVGLQEYGKPNPSLLAGLEARGARVVNVKVYRWDLPEDTKPLEDNVRALARGEVDVVLFTSANQVVNLFAVAENLEMVEPMLGALRSAVVASIGPTTSEALREHDLPVDLEPDHSKMGHLVIAAAGRGGEILQRKRHLAKVLSDPEAGIPDKNAPWQDSIFMRACRREPCAMTPIWLMRQAGRYMSEYRKIRSTTTFLELCKSPALCSEIMVTAVEKLGVDAAIIFSDLLPILEPMGLQLEYAPGEGPQIHNPVREPSDVDRVLELESVDALHFVMETVQQTRADLPENIPLIGFSGAPFTLASYAIEGGSSRNHVNTKTLMYRDEEAWQALMQRFVRAVTMYLNAQIAAGAGCVQLFDSWAGCLEPEDYRRYALPYVQQIVQGITPAVPVINFATGNPALLPLLAESGSAVVGIDWRVPLDQAWKTVGYDRAVQGNLDPAALLADVPEIRRRAKHILDLAAGRPGHIFNLGHGVLPQTPPDSAVELVRAVHELSAK